MTIEILINVNVDQCFNFTLGYADKRDISILNNTDSSCREVFCDHSDKIILQ